MTKIKLDKCPKCGGSKYYIKTYLKGMVPKVYNFADNKPDESIDQYKNLFEVYHCNYLYCYNCGKRLNKIDEVDLSGK